ncbi:hypothetical protein BU23DRAFT_565451 [Bimuria novae-zelandiae CBS 107.79]|uniref:Mid2 domain-containing protein n=1 Tax=Bimuria novae-zelandiae CBS 107.79 TaxID=1447943 RepID=A0A6A5VU41_9PLEO|nr:hypothetical protein BU23DRAFT_565451 [Bimuria novae-zelandiae CBS 107.79]
MIYFTVKLLGLFLPGTSASLAISIASHNRLHRRQAIPDSSGNTGNIPGPIKPEPSPRPLTLSTSTTVIIIPSACPMSRPTPTSSTVPSVTNGDGSDRNRPTTPPGKELQLTRTNFVLSPRMLAGIITGGFVFILLLIALSIFIFRRKRRPDITEIPIRRSKLGSRLRHRIFNSPMPPSRTSSRSSGSTLTGDSRQGWLRKDSIGRPMPANCGEGELLSVPQAAFMKNEREGVEDVERWVDKGMISEPRPVRPVSAEPLGRLSGMGMGMGYLK